jgi:hypothetical protein
MLRVRLFAAATIVTAALAGCSDSTGLFKPAPPPAQALQFDSQPPGADVRTAQGQTCQTPCSLPVPVMSQSVSFAMNGYMPQTIQINVREPAEHSLFNSTPPDLAPNPVVASLQAVAPPPPHKPVVKPRPRRLVARAAAPPRPMAQQPPPAPNDGFPPPPPFSAPTPFPPQPPNTQ